MDNQEMHLYTVQKAYKKSGEITQRLMLQGDWLGFYGFEEGTKVTITVSKDKMVIEPVSEDVL